ncbi:hypothetical protein AUR64_12490 [Haloprofundus marisrubri]|uniref:PKD domain-containing protein n=1 Tax=Haloprofundus marisrubri TaxID=1514971 RepID=A0A0W1RA99_9EURY|nr:PKD domain-containing protein [Haloprofundus marisrubri]KTG10380.1 hypothetical protein AUR64_12490 [Haloprofundus marisrubri]
MNERRLFVVLLVVTATIPNAAVGTAPEPPLVDAGLDQTVERGSTVLLDGTGSRDPDGELTSYQWSIRGPDGRTVVPKNASAPHTSFVPDVVGRFEVTLTVTDDEGKTSSDTLYVTVEPGDAPSVRLSGPEDGFVGQERRFRVEITRGAAPLDTAVWRVDGTVVSRQSLSPEAAVAVLEMPFGTAETHDISVTVVDGDNRSDTDSKSVHIAAEASAEPDTGETAPTGPDSDPTVVRGDRVVTGERPLEGPYRVDAPSFANVETVEWYSERGLIGNGERFSHEWDPGTHTLYAVLHYETGSRDVARFEDGERSVVADPRPNASVSELRLERGTVSGTAVGSDAFGNLRAMTVSLDGRQIASWSGSGSGVSRNDLSFEANATPNEDHVLRVTVVDARGQKRVFTRSVTPSGSPEIVSSRFLNTPVDSYHERIDSERYIAYHEMRIDLNGADPEDVSTQSLIPTGHTKIVIEGINREHHDSDDLLIVRRGIHAQTPGSYPIMFKLGYKLGPGDVASDTLAVERSPPELRVNVSYHNEKRAEGDRPVVIDASDSFDPDGTELKYSWRDDMYADDAIYQPVDFTNLASMKIGIIDAYGYTTTDSKGLVGYYTPRVGKIKIVRKQQSYLPNETVRVNIVTQEYAQLGGLAIGLDVQNADNYHIKKWGPDYGGAPDNYKGEIRWNGTIEIPASEFQDVGKDPTIKLYNKENPNITVRSEDVPSVAVYEPTRVRFVGQSINNLKYTVLNTEYNWRQATDYTSLQRYREAGYVVDTTDRKGVEYNIQEYKKTQSAKYNTEQQHFDRYDSRKLLLDTNSDWVAAGSETTTDMWYTTESEWRDNKAGEGSFTGDTRTVRVEPARYRTERQYEYDHRVRKTGTRRVTETRTRTTTEVRERPVTRCTQWGCFESTERYTVTDRETYTVTTTETYSYYTTETESYWSTQPFRSDHYRTGDVRRIQTAPAEYEKQYQYEYRERHEETTTTYIAEKREQVRPAQYGWVHYETTTSGPRADQITRHDGFRVASTSKIRRWSLKKKVSESKETSNTYDDANDVIRTQAEVEGHVEQTLTDPMTGDTVTQTIGNSEQEFIASGLYTRSEILSNSTVSKTTSEACDCGRRR